MHAYALICMNIYTCMSTSTYACMACARRHKHAWHACTMCRALPRTARVLGPLCGAPLWAAPPAPRTGSPAAPAH